MPEFPGNTRRGGVALDRQIRRTSILETSLRQTKRLRGASSSDNAAEVRNSSHSIGVAIRQRRCARAWAASSHKTKAQYPFVPTGGANTSWTRNLEIGSYGCYLLFQAADVLSCIAVQSERPTYGGNVSSRLTVFNLSGLHSSLPGCEKKRAEVCSARQKSIMEAAASFCERGTFCGRLQSPPARSQEEQQQSHHQEQLAGMQAPWLRRHQ